MEPEVIEETEMLPESTKDSKEKTVVSDEDKRLKYFVQRMKLAVAIAIIRSTPPGMTPQAYALHLSQCLNEDNSKWKNKCEALERELLALKQKLETITLKEKFPIPSMGLSLFAGDLALPVKTPSCVVVPPDLKTKICDAVEFIRSFIYIGSVSHDDVDLNNPKTSGKMRETILLSVSLMFEHLRSDQGLSLEYDIARCAIEEVHRFYDSRANIFEKDLTEICLKFVEDLLFDIYRTLKINMVEYQHRRSSLIQMLAEHKKLSALILCRLLREITIYSDNFRTLFETGAEDYTPLLRMENAYFVLQTTEGTLHVMRKQKSSLNALKIPKPLLAEWNMTAEKSLLEIGSRFSLYSIYVWNIKTLLQSIFEFTVDV